MEKPETLVTIAQCDSELRYCASNAPHYISISTACQQNAHLPLSFKELQVRKGVLPMLPIGANSIHFKKQKIAYDGFGVLGMINYIPLAKYSMHALIN